VFVLFHHQNKFEINYASAIWWRHLPAACNNFFEAGVSGNTGCLKSPGAVLRDYISGTPGMTEMALTPKDASHP
jgi:hypothetical protein